MTTLADLVAAEPDPTFGHVMQWPGWRFVAELADPTAGVSVVWYDITEYVAGYQLDRGADQANGPYKAAVATVDLFADDDRLMPWAVDTSPTFGTHVQLGAGALVRAGFIRVAGGVVADWLPRFTHRVESWSDAQYAAGQIRQHRLVTRDLSVELVNVPVGASTAENWPDRLIHVLTEAGWPYGSGIFGAQLTSGAADILTLAARDESSSAISELDATCAPAGIVWHTNRKGQIRFRPQLGDTFHADAFTAGATGDPWPEPAAVSFSYQAGLAADVGVEYADAPGDPFGFGSSELGVINRLIVNDDGPSPYDIDDPASIERYGYRPRTVTWQVANDTVADDLLAWLIQAEIDVAPLITSIDMDGFQRVADLDHLFPVTYYHQTAPGRALISVEGHVRALTERVAPRGPGEVSWAVSITSDCYSWVETDELNPVVSLAASAVGDLDATITWTNPSQTITPTGTQFRVRSVSAIWLDMAYPITSVPMIGLQPSTEYSVDVRLIARNASGIVYAYSPVRTVTFTTDSIEVPGPIGDDGTVPTPPPDPGCEIDWILEESADGSTWSTIDSGTLQAGETLVIDPDDLTYGYLYRVTTTEDCGGVLGTPQVGQPFVKPDVCVVDALDHDFLGDPTLVAYVPEVCNGWRVQEYLSGQRGFYGPSFGGLGIGGDTIVMRGPDSGNGGIVSFGPAPGADNLGSSDKTLGARFRFGDSEVGLIAQAAGLELRVYTDGSQYFVRAVAHLVDGSTITATGTTVLAVGNTYRVYATFTAANGTPGVAELRLFVDGVNDATSTAAAPIATTYSTPNWFAGATSSGWVTDLAVWNSIVITPAVINDPTDVADLFAWLDASDTASIDHTSNAVDRWEGQVNPTTIAFAAAGANRPTTNTRTQNGLNVIDFDGVNDVLSAGSDPIWNMADDGMTLLIVCGFDANDTTFGVIGRSQAADANGRWSLVYAATGGPQALYDPGTHVEPKYTDAGVGMRLFRIRVHRDGASSWIEIAEGGVVKATVNPFTDPGTSWNTTQHMYIGAYQNAAGNNPLAGYFMDGIVCEVIRYDRAISDTEVAALEAILTTKWGL